MGALHFTSLARGIEIGANSYLLECAGKSIVLDAGLHPRLDGDGALPQFGLLPGNAPDAIILTHAHQDHVGALPVLMRRQPQAPVFMTEATRELSEIMLHNSVNVMMRRQEGGGAARLHFSHREVDVGMRRWIAAPLRQRFDLTGERLRWDEESDISVEFFDAGHILGSAGALVRSNREAIFYTGDVNFEDQTVMQAAAFPEQDVDVLIIETTRGDRVSPPGFSRAKEELRFASAIEDVLERGGAVFIPVFALGKTQEVLAMFNRFHSEDLLRRVPIYIGGLSTKLTELHDRLAALAPREKRRPHLLDTEGLFTLAGPEAMAAKIRSGRIYALSSGMMTEKTLSNSLARQVLQDPRNAFLFVGYADPDSPAGRLRATAPGEAVQLSADAPPQELRCAVEEFSFSGHATRESILAYILRLRPKTVVLVHGDAAAVAWFQSVLSVELPSTRVISPQPGDRIDLGDQT